MGFGFDFPKKRRKVGCFLEGKYDNLQDDNTETKLRRNKLVVIVIDGWVIIYSSVTSERQSTDVLQQLISGSDGTTLRNTRRKLVGIWQGFRSSWRPGFTQSILNPFSLQSPFLPGRPYRLVSPHISRYLGPAWTRQIPQYKNIPFVVCCYLTLGPPCQYL